MQSGCFILCLRSADETYVGHHFLYLLMYTRPKELCHEAHTQRLVDQRMSVT